METNGVRLTFRSENETDEEMPFPTLNPISCTLGLSRGSCRAI